jgi:hypothetical protein
MKRTGKLYPFGAYVALSRSKGTLYQTANSDRNGPCSVACLEVGAASLHIKVYHLNRRSSTWDEN